MRPQRARPPVRRARGAAALLLALACGSLPARTGASEPPAAPEPAAAALERLRLLAENDPARALREAEDRFAALPPDAAALERIGLRNVRARAELYLGSAKNAREHAEAARADAEAAGDRAGQVEANLTLSVTFIFLGRIADSYDATTRALTLVDGVERPELVAEAMLSTCAMYQRRGQLEELVETAFQSMEIARRSQVPLALVHAYQALAVAYLQAGRPADSREQFELMLAAARAARAARREADALLGISAAMQGLGELAEAERRSREAIAIYRRIGTPFGEGPALYNLAHVLRRQGHLAEALAALDRIAAIYEPSPNRLGLWWTLRERSLVLRELHRQAAAEADIRRAYALAQEVGVSFYRSESAKLLAALAADRGDHRRAYAYLLEANEMTARTASEGASARFLELTRRYQAESRVRELEALARRDREQEMKLQQQALRQRWLWTILLLGAVLLAGTAYFLVRLRRSHALLELANTELERRVAARTAELQDANRELEAFAYSVSHDLRAPVRQIAGFAGLLGGRAPGALDSSARELLDGIAGSARRMGALIEDLLSFSRTTRAELLRGPVDLDALAREVIRDLSAEAAGRDVAWELGALPVVDGARPLLRIVLANLLSNALKYTRPRAQARIELGARVVDGEATVFVRDNGVGFDPRYVERLFGVFQRLHGPDEFEGTGIGLATVRRIVSRHGGRTWAEGRLGEGATFFFSLPAPDAVTTPRGAGEAPREAPPPAATAAPGQGDRA